jgi:hypothetical protein
MIKALIKFKNTRCLLLILNLYFACLPFWHTGKMVICNCGDCHIIIKAKDGQCCQSRCNDGNIGNDETEKTHSLCFCVGIPISKDIYEHTACYNNMSGSVLDLAPDENGLSRAFETRQENPFGHAVYFPVAYNNTIDILRTIILLI